MNNIVNSISSYWAIMPESCPVDSELGSLYLTPYQHIIEYVLVNILFLICCMKCYKIYKKQQINPILNNSNVTKSNIPTNNSSSTKLSMVDKILLPIFIF